jgi:glycosyltransferase involved in cell wall biosynthesis
MSLAEQFRIAAIVPCHNEEVAVAKVVADLQASVPGMTVYVYDNCSTDRTIERARQAGAVIRSEPLKGKGNVVRRAFADIDADIYLLIDGDDTYDAAAAPRLIEKLVQENLDHVIGVRREVEGEPGSSAYRPAHQVGNRVLNRIVCAAFGDTLGDMLSGYRVFSRRFVKSFPAVSREFEIETELTVHSLALRIPSTSVTVDFRDRAVGSESKLRTYRDGWKILNVIVNLARHERPITFFGYFAAVSTLVAVALGAPVLKQYLETGAVPRFPSLFVAAFLLLTSCLAMVAGLVMDGIRKARHEHSRLAYMRYPAVAITEPEVYLQPRPAVQVTLPEVPAQLPAMLRTGMQVQAG